MSDVWGMQDAEGGMRALSPIADAPEGQYDSPVPAVEGGGGEYESSDSGDGDGKIASTTTGG